MNKKKNTNNKYKTYKELEVAYQSGEIHPIDLKEAVAANLIEILEPVRKYFSDGNGKRYLEDLKDITITR